MTGAPTTVTSIGLKGSHAWPYQQCFIYLKVLIVSFILFVIILTLTISTACSIVAIFVKLKPKSHFLLLCGWSIIQRDIITFHRYFTSFYPEQDVLVVGRHFSAQVVTLNLWCSGSSESRM